MSQSNTFTTPIAEDTASGWPARRVATILAGSLLALLGLTLLGAGAAALWTDLTRRDQGYVTTDLHRFSTSGSAIVTEETELGKAGIGWLYSPGLLGKVRIRVTPRSPGSTLFVGIGHSSDVDRYLSGVGRAVISEFFKGKADPLDGHKGPAAPSTQHFWAASAAGTGSQTILWTPRTGSWKVVVMNTDAQRSLDVDADLGARFAALPWIALGALTAGALIAALSAFLIFAAIRGDRGRTSTT